MAKLTLTFKDKLLQVFYLQPDIPVHIGNDETNTVFIDSMAVAPVHAVLLYRDDDNAFIKPLNDQFPIYFNGEPTERHDLESGDKIFIGKHMLQYVVESNNIEMPQDVQPADEDAADESDHQEVDIGGIPDYTAEDSSVDANFQVMSGKHIGRVIPLTRGMTRLGKAGSGVVVVAKRKDGFYASSLEGESKINVNGKPFGQDTIKLNENDILEIDNIEMLFFMDE